MGVDVTLQADFAALARAVAQDRDRRAFAALFEHFAPRLNGYLLRTGADSALAEEIVQDVMTTLWRKADLFDPAKSSLSTWLYRIARNRRIDLIRRVQTKQLDGEDPVLLPPDIVQPDAAMDLQQREAAMREALKVLPPEQLDLVRLAFFEGLSHGDIAEQTGLPLGTVKSRIRLAFTRLRRELEAAGIVSPP